MFVFHTRYKETQEFFMIPDISIGFSVKTIQGSLRKQLRTKDAFVFYHTLQGSVEISHDI